MVIPCVSFAVPVIASVAPFALKAEPAFTSSAPGTSGVWPSVIFSRGDPPQTATGRLPSGARVRFADAVVRVFYSVHWVCSKLVASSLCLGMLTFLRKCFICTPLN